MLNKKILAVAIAATLSSNAFAVVDIEADTGSVVFATELFDATDLDGDGNLPVTNAGNILDVTFQTGFTVAQGTSKYVKVKLTNAAFGAGASLTSGVGGFSATISQNGTAGDTEVLFEITSPANDIAAADVLTLVAASYAIDPDAAATVDIALYETAGDAVNEVNPLYTESGTLASTASGSTGVVTIEGTNVATVASGFLDFDADSLGANLASIGQIDIDEILDGTSYLPNGTAAVATDFVTDAQDITFAGDFSYGTWTLQDDLTCAGGGATVDVSAGINMAETASTVTIASLAAGPWALCLAVNGTDEVIQKDVYTVTLDTDNLTNDIGEIKYDTTSIEVPYITTFSDLNQRFYLINYSNTPVAYSFSFVSENGVTADPLTGASGTIPANEVLALRADQVVEITGRTRTSAIIEVEAVDADVAATTQTVNTLTGTTDTVVLN